MSDWTLRRTRAGDGPALRELRRQMLTDTPIAFVRTWAVESQHPDSLWEARATSAGGAATWVVEVGGHLVGQLVCSLDDEDTAWLGAVFLDPAHRGAGHLERLVAEAVGWARHRGARRLRLEVARENLPAVAAYRRLGFVETGPSRPHPLYPEVTEIELEYPL